MAKNYTDEQTKHMIDVYQANPCRETVDKLALEMGKTVKSVIGKLSREKVYIKKDYTTKRGEKPITKLQMVQEIADMLRGDKERLQTLEKSSKAELLYLKVLVEDLKEGFQYENFPYKYGSSPYNSPNRYSNTTVRNSNGITHLKRRIIMTTFFIVTSIVLGTMILAGLKDAKKQNTAFYKSRDKATHFHY